MWVWVCTRVWCTDSLVLLISCLEASQKRHWPQVGWLCFWGEKLKTGIKITQTLLKIRLVFLQGVHLPEKKIHIYKGRAKWGTVVWVVLGRTRTVVWMACAKSLLRSFMILVPLCLPGRMSLFFKVCFKSVLSPLYCLEGHSWIPEKPARRDFFFFWEIICYL